MQAGVPFQLRGTYEHAAMRLAYLGCAEGIDSVQTLGVLHKQTAVVVAHIQIE